MDSKQKFIRNRYWKRKYQPHNATITVSIQKSIEQKKNDSLIKYGETSNIDIVLNQPIPKKGWFPEYDLSSSTDTENDDTLINDQNIVPISKLINIDNNKECDTNWFSKELDNIQLSSEISPTRKLKDKLKLTCQINTNNLASNSDTEINVSEGKKNDNEEAELEFLLSLKEPIFTGPIIIKKSIENERKIAVNAQQKPIKSNDLEKWLDSVLDE